MFANTPAMDQFTSTMYLIISIILYNRFSISTFTSDSKDIIKENGTVPSCAFVRHGSK